MLFLPGMPSNLCLALLQLLSRCHAVRARRVKDLLRRLLAVDPAKRLTARQALRHPWVKGLVNNLSFTVKRQPPGSGATQRRASSNRQRAHRTTSDHELGVEAGAAALGR